MVFERLRFYITHSINDLIVSGQRTIFGIFCVMSGVAAIVGLLTLGVMVDDSLTGSLQESNRGDVAISTGAVSDNGDAIVDGSFTDAGVTMLKEWLAEQENVPLEDVCTSRSDLCVTERLSLPGSSITTDEFRASLFTVIFAVDTALYPLYGTVETDDGRSLSEAIDVSTYNSDEIDVVISQNLSDQLELNEDHTFTMLGLDATFRVKGIVPTRSEGGLENLPAGVFGFVYMDTAIRDRINFGTIFDEEEEAETDEDDEADFSLDSLANYSDLYIRLEDTSRTVEIGDTVGEAFLSEEARERGAPGILIESTTTEDLRENNETLSIIVTQFNSMMGLLALLIGGIGIVNTMLVIVRRRTGEIAILKTVGVQPGEVSTLFFTQSVLMGLIGSIIGIPFGFLIAFLTREAVGAFVAQDLTFRVAPEPILIGLVVGTLITAIFGFFPTLSAGQVRPATVLQPQARSVPKAGISRSVFALLVVILSLSAITQGLLNDLLASEDLDTLRTIAQFAVGVMGLIMGLAMVGGGIWASWTRGILPLRLVRWLLLIVGLPVGGFILGQELSAVALMIGFFIQTGILYVLLWILVWLVGRFLPTFRIIDLKIAKRGMLSQKGRVASTLLAFIVGVFTLSLVVMMVTTIDDALEGLLEDFTGGNIIVFALDTGAEDVGLGGLEEVEARLEAGISGVEYYGVVRTYDANLVSFTDVSAGETISRDVISRDFNIFDSEFFTPTIDSRTLNESLPDVSFTQGEQLSSRNAGQFDIIIPDSNVVQQLGIVPGDQLTFTFASEDSGTSDLFTFTVVGLSTNDGDIQAAGSLYYIPPGVLPDSVEPISTFALVNAFDDRVEDVGRELRSIPNVFVLETRLINDIINRLLDTFTSLPIVVSIVVLIVGGVVIANSVALAMLERRREIAIMKAVGLQRRRVLGMLLIENAITGIIGGLIGVGLSALILLAILVLLFQSSLGEAIPWTQAFLLMTMCIAIAMAASIVSVWGASSEKPLTVLRYE